MTTTRRAFIKRGSLFLAASGSLGSVILGASPASASPRRCGAVPGFGELVPDPQGILDLPAGFSYVILSRTGEPMSDGALVPSSHDGMGAFSAGRLGTWLVRNHELSAEDVADGGLTPVAALAGATYDPAGSGGTTTLLVSGTGELIRHAVSLAGTLDNCGGGPSPWRTWLTCEETLDELDLPHGYVFEVDPWRGGNPEPIIAMGRFEHEAVSFDRRGCAYLTEDAARPFGCVYRFLPDARLAGRGSLHGGGRLEALAVSGVSTDLSEVTEAGTRLPVRWIPVPNVNPLGADTSVREQSIALGATPIKKAEGTWQGADGSIWFVSSYAGGPLAEDADDRTAAAHAGQIWRYDPRSEQLELVVSFAPGSPYDGPDNITVGPHGYAVACTDGEADQFLIGIDPLGAVFPIAHNAASHDELAGAAFSPDGSILFANIQGEPAFSLAISGPWGAAAE